LTQAVSMHFLAQFVAFPQCPVILCFITLSEKEMKLPYDSATLCVCVCRRACVYWHPSHFILWI